jgi:catechol 2,3-dioxygenase-like lactoylglutathione lyase family enzyme
MRSAVLVLLSALVALADDVPRPRITGIAQISLFVSDADRARLFYQELLGYKQSTSGKLSTSVFHVNERQSIELLPEVQPATDRLNHIALATDAADQLRRYLLEKGIKAPASISRSPSGDMYFDIVDPDGHSVRFVQFARQRKVGHEHRVAPISNRMLHVGITVGPLAPAMNFYKDVLGFSEIWRGSSNEKVLSWINMKVPDGDDYVEFMLYDEIPAPTKRGGAHHICLAVPDMEKAAAVLKTRAFSAEYPRAMEPRVGINRRRQLNLYDPDGTRTELMEPHTVDGKPAPSSSASPPR